MTKALHANPAGASTSAGSAGMRSLKGKSKMTNQAPQTLASVMSRYEYLVALEQLGLTPASKETARALGLSVRQIQKIAAGTAKVPGPVRLLLAMYLRHGRQAVRAVVSTI